MELQELVVRGITAQLRFRLAPRFADIRGTMIEELQSVHDLTEYGWSESHLQVFNEDRTRQLIVGSRELRLISEHIERLDDVVETGRSFFARGLEELGVETVEFLGVRTYWMAAVDSFEDLVAWMRDHLSPDEPFSGAVSSKLTDVGWVFEYREKSPSYVVRTGPMKIEQALEQVFATEKRDLFPDAFLFMDLDRVLPDADLAAGDAPDRWEDALRSNLDAGGRIAAALQGMK